MLKGVLNVKKKKVNKIPFKIKKIMQKSAFFMLKLLFFFCQKGAFFLVFFFFFFAQTHWED